MGYFILGQWFQQPVKFSTSRSHMTVGERRCVTDVDDDDENDE
jgi:hypothetical protein